MNKSRRISMGAMVSIISIVLIFIGSVIPKTTMVMVSLASFLIAILIIEAGVSTAVVSFIATTILGFIVVPNKVLVLQNL